MPEVLTDAKTIFGAVLNTPFDVFKSKRQIIRRYL